MGFLVLIAIGLVIYLVTKRPSGSVENLSVSSQLEARNWEWAQFIANYRASATTKSEKALLAKMLADIAAQGLPVPPGIDAVTSAENTPTGALEPSIQMAANAQSQSASTFLAPPVKNKAQVQLDNASLLLYFGAFLFVASTGLFVVFGGVSGGLRTAIVVIVMGIMYGSGAYLVKNKKKFEQAGLAFAGIGMAIAPLVGLAAYSYLFDKSHGATVWLFTSILCMGLYAHALVVLRKPLINYLLIFTFLSLFESGVSIVNAPIYYFGWMMAIVGIILSAVSHLKGFWPEMRESTWSSGAIFLPIAVFASIVIAPKQGIGQLGVSLLIAAVYYALETLHTTAEHQESNAIVAQMATLAGAVCLGFAGGHQWPFVANILFGLAVVQLVVILSVPAKTQLWQNFASIAIVAQIAATIASLAHPTTLFVATVVSVVLATAIWLRQKRIEAYGVAALSLVALPVVYGQSFLQPHLSAQAQVPLIAGALMVQLAILLGKFGLTDEQHSGAQQVYVVSGVVLVAAGIMAGGWINVGIGMGTALTMLLLAETQKDTDWSVISGLFVAAPLLRGFETQGAFLAAMVVALGLNILLALNYKKEANRWFSTVLWLLLPVALGDGILGSKWGPAAYGWAYVVVMIGLVFSRAIARGVILLSERAPLASFDQNASASYVAGYIIAGVVSILAVLADQAGHIHTTLVLAIVGCVVWFLCEFVEKNSQFLWLLPLFAQAVLLSALRPTVSNGLVSAYLLCSTSLALTSYFILHEDNPKAKIVRTGALLAIYITPAAALLDRSHVIWPMPFGFLAASILVYYHVRGINQQDREAAGGLMLLSIYWFMSFWGITAVQAYTHVLVGLFAGYAIWRYARGEMAQSEQYIYAALITATVPLVLQALGGTGGGVYGWWLLLEEVFIMMIGMSIGKKFVTMWGLYVAIGAVLYQLRNLGWAALTVLALFLIGMAVYKIQKYNEK